MTATEVLLEKAPEALPDLLADVNEAVRDIRPPALKAMEAVRLIEVEHKSTREAARRLKVSQTRVRQLVDQVQAYLARVSPAVKNEATVQQQMHVAEGLRLERLKYLYRRTMQSFRQSRGQKTVIRVVSSLLGDRETHTTTECHGDIRYLQMAMRISETMSQVPDSGLLNRAYLAAMEAEGETDEGCGEEGVSAEQGFDRPPVGDCSTSAVGATKTAPEKRSDRNLTDGVKTTYTDRCRDEFNRLRDALVPARLAELDGLAREYEVPEDATAEPRQPLNRQERRARQRQLEKRRRKPR